MDKPAEVSINIPNHVLETLNSLQMIKVEGLAQRNVWGILLPFTEVSKESARKDIKFNFPNLPVPWNLYYYHMEDTVPSWRMLPLDGTIPRLNGGIFKFFISPM